MIKSRTDITSGAMRLSVGSDPSEAFSAGRAGGERAPGLMDPGLRRLMLAVLESALESYRKFFSKPSRKVEAQFHEVEEWIASDNDDLFSFRTVCESLGIDPDWLRRELALWRQGLRMESERAYLLRNGPPAKKPPVPSRFNPVPQKKRPAVA